MKELRKITAEELKTILAEHEKWLKTKRKEGMRADLSAIDLREADLSMVILREANLVRADLGGANLKGADLREANLNRASLNKSNLSGADLTRADLREADLKHANLCKTNLRGAYLRNADLSGACLIMADIKDADLTRADLRDADLKGANFNEATLVSADLSGANYFIPSVCPTEGSFIGWKAAIAAGDRSGVVVKLLIPEDALRSSGTSRKCRASKATVIDIQSFAGESLKGVIAYSIYNSSFVYEIGEIVEPDSFDKDRYKECSNGIHFFMDRQEAVNYVG